MSFNLIDEKWIPCVPIDGGSVVDVGIAEALTRASDYREIYDNSPLVTVSLHRLLLAILYRACGPTGLREARALVRDGLPVDAIRSYLDKWRDRFDLFSEKYPFYQTAGLGMTSPSGLSRLANEVNFGGIFDHTADGGSPEYSLAQAARLLVAAQSYALGFGKSSNATIGVEKIEPPYSSDAILLRGVTVWLTGRHLRDTLLINLCPPGELDEDDIPAWELDAPHTLRDTLVNGKRRSISARGVMDRYTWQSRLMRIIPTEVSGKTIIKEVYFTQGRDADKSPDDPMKAYVKSEKEGFIPVSLSMFKASWRDIHSILTSSRDVALRPRMLDTVAELLRSNTIAPGTTYTVNVVGLATAPNKAGKFVLWRHDRLPAPAELLKSDDLVERLSDQLQVSERTGRILWHRARELCAAYLSMGDKKADPDAVTKLAEEIDPRRDYWARLEGHFHTLLRELPFDKEAASNSWRGAIAKEAHTAFIKSANQLGQSARAIRARAKVNPRFDQHNDTSDDKHPNNGEVIS